MQPLARQVPELAETVRHVIETMNNSIITSSVGFALTHPFWQNPLMRVTFRHYEMN